VDGVYYTRVHAEDTLIKVSYVQLIIFSNLRYKFKCEFDGWR
jgi:hypothetical protein